RREDRAANGRQQRQRREISEQDVLEHVEAEELLAERMDRRDERDEEQSDPRREEADAPARHGGAASAEGAHPTGIERREQQGRDDLQRIERPAGVDWQVG